MIKLLITLAVITLTVKSAVAFEIDFSRRAPFMKSHELQSTTPPPTATPEPFTVQAIQNNFEPSQDVVILNTEKGFIPESLSLRAGIKYKVHVVNVNENEKNVSFIMSAFGQHHGTYYGQIKSFEVTPTKEGVYTYQCPETSLEGKVVVIPQTDRAVAGEK
jgi:plastocyanin